MKKTLIYGSLILVISLYNPPAVRAERITLTSGDVIEGIIIAEDKTTVTVKFDAGMIDLDRTTITSITPSIISEHTQKVQSESQPDKEQDNTFPTQQKKEINVDKAEAEKFFTRYFGNKDAFKKAFNKMKEREDTHPDDLENKYHLSICYYHLGQYEDALNKLHAIYAKKQNDLDVMLYLGHAYNKNGNLDNAIVYFKKRLSIRTADIRTRSTLAFCYAQRGDYDNAIVEFEKILSSKPEDLVTIKQLLVLYEKVGNRKGLERIRTHRKKLETQKP